MVVVVVIVVVFKFDPFMNSFILFQSLICCLVWNNTHTHTIISFHNFTSSFNNQLLCLQQRGEFKRSTTTIKKREENSSKFLSTIRVWIFIRARSSRLLDGQTYMNMPKYLSRLSTNLLNRLEDNSLISYSSKVGRSKGLPSFMDARKNESTLWQYI